MAESDGGKAGPGAGGGSQIHIDSDWKAQARAEKERLEEKLKPSAAPGGAGPGAAPGATGRAGGVPKASFQTMVNNLATQALLFMGAVPDPRTGQRIQHLDLARFHIDTLAVLQEKTKGNLSDDEEKLLSTSLYELRQAYIQIANAMREQSKA